MPTDRYDVFLSHNSHDKPLVEQIAQRLVEEAKLRPFLDRWHLIPGVEWQSELEEALRQSKTVAVFIGPSGNGPWHHEEMQVALKRAVREKQEFRIIPVLLPEGNVSSMSEFLQLRTWVDFSAGANNEIAFKRLVAGILGKVTEFEGITLPDQPAPYRGLMQFKPEHARFFFGREKDTQRLIEKLRTQRFVAVVGSSGSGKSSIVGAGLLPRLAQDAIPGSKNWRTVTFTPADDPWRSLAISLASDHPPEKRGAIVTELMTQFDEPETGLRHTLQSWFADTSEPLLLFVDQFEELFTHAPTLAATAARYKYDERIGCFVRQLAHEILRPDERFRVVITLRADFLPHCLRIPELKGLMQYRQLLLGELATDEAALREVIQRPAQQVSAMLETGLMEVLLADVRGQTGTLPLLEDTLSELWRKRRGPWLTMAAYIETGGVSGAFVKRAEETLMRLTEPQQRIARRIFVKLTSLEEDTEDTRRQVDRKSLYAETTEKDQIDAVVNVLAGAEARLIVVGTESLSIAHETLIQNWPTLREWLKADRQLERIHRDLENSADEWNDMNRGKHPLGHTTSVQLAETETHALALADRTTTLEREFLKACRQERDAENHRRSRLSQLAVGVVFFTLVVIILAGIKWWQEAKAQKVAVDATKIGKQMANVAEANRLLAHFAAASKDDFKDPDGLPDDITIFGPQESDYQLQDRRTLLAVEAGKATQHDEEGLLPSSHKALLEALGNWQARPVSERRTDSLGEITPTFPLLVHEIAATCFDITADGRWLVTDGEVGSVRVWDLQSQDPTAKPRLLKGHKNQVQDVAISAAGQLIVAADFDKVCVWDLLKPDPVPCQTVVDGQYFIAAISADGRWILAYAARDKGGFETELWDLDSSGASPLRRKLNLGDSIIKSAAFSLDGNWLVTGGWNDTRIWKLTSASIADPRIMEGPEASEAGVQISPDSQWIVTAGKDYPVRLSSLVTGESRRLGETGSPVDSVAISTDGHWLLTGGYRSETRVWNLQDLNEPHKDLAGYQPSGSPVVAISSDSTLMVSVSKDDAVIWDWPPSNGNEPKLTFKLSQNSGGGRWKVAVSSGNRWIVEANQGGPVNLWAWRWDDLQAAARKAVGRNFTREEFTRYFPGQEDHPTFDDLPFPHDPAKITETK